MLVGADEIEYEVEARLENDGVVLHFHPRCYDAWRTSRESSEAPPGA
ncbi:MAG TPA: hypothetical protein VMU52_07150 [Steroidobacteraceae bacterium]|nr:hypothetical protein [Steroidobacteraceae bacterium]